MEVLRNGSSGDGVEALQQKLLGQGINPGPIDGVFGPKTEDAVKRFQERDPRPRTPSSVSRSARASMQTALPVQRPLPRWE
jgi:peptidoglycan hydrolase-like protein with peptidoglycan-binding domain